jgi:hypothetical protein
MKYEQSTIIEKKIHLIQRILKVYKQGIISAGLAKFLKSELYLPFFMDFRAWILIHVY